MKRILTLMLMVGIVVTAGCRLDHENPIVQAYRDAGGGDVTQSTPDSIAQFLSKHDELRKQLTPLCQQQRTSAEFSANDAGKVCDGNTRANFFGKTKVRSDGVAF